MDDLEAAATLKSLAAGLDPGTGTPLAAALAPLAAPDVARALYLAADALEARQRQARRQSSLPRNAGKPWSAAEDERLLTAFDAGSGVDTLRRGPRAHPCGHRGAPGQARPAGGRAGAGGPLPLNRHPRPGAPAAR